MYYEIVKQSKTAVSLLLLLTLLTGFIYPLLVTTLAQWLFPWRANGSMIYQAGKPMGSHLIGQSFTASQYFWGRPSVTIPYAYNAAHSQGSNMSASNPVYLQQVQMRVRHLKQQHLTEQGLVPVDLVMASGSGLDPDISVAAAYYQVTRIAAARQIDPQVVRELIARLSTGHAFGLFGPPRVNVLALNLALNQLGTDDDRSTSRS